MHLGCSLLGTAAMGWPKEDMKSVTALFIIIIVRLRVNSDRK